jgi:hypothetical protein
MAISFFCCISRFLLLVLVLLSLTAVSSQPDVGVDDVQWLLRAVLASRRRLMIFFDLSTLTELI